MVEQIRKCLLLIVVSINPRITRMGRMGLKVMKCYG